MSCCVLSMARRWLKRPLCVSPDAHQALGSRVNWCSCSYKPAAFQKGVTAQQARSRSNSRGPAQATSLRAHPAWDPQLACSSIHGPKRIQRRNGWKAHSQAKALGVRTLLAMRQLCCTCSAHMLAAYQASQGKPSALPATRAIQSRLCSQQSVVHECSCQRYGAVRGQTLHAVIKLSTEVCTRMMTDTVRTTAPFWAHNARLA